MRNVLHNVGFSPPFLGSPVNIIMKAGKVFVQWLAYLLFYVMRWLFLPMALGRAKTN